MEINIKGTVELSPGNKVEVPVTIIAEVPDEKGKGCGPWIALSLSIILNVILIYYFGGSC